MTIEGKVIDIAGLYKVFEDIKNNKEKWLGANKGNIFEDIIETSLKENGFNRINLKNDSILEKYIHGLKEIILDKSGNKILRNDFEERQYKNCFICQPYGSQEFPDFLILTEKFIFAVETKFSSNKSVKPMWNSNLPKNNAFYIFASYGRKDVTFFKGSDVLPIREREELNNFFEKRTKELEADFKKELKRDMEENGLRFERGFNVYIRKAFEQNRTINENAIINYFEHPKRDRIEDKVIRLLKFSSKIEKN